VKAASLAEQGNDFDVSAVARVPWTPATLSTKETKMSRKILSLAGHYLFRKEGVSTFAFDTPSKAAAVCPQASEPDDGTVRVEDVRAVATEGALATAVDASPAVLVSLWAHDQRLHPGHGRPLPRRGA
jgi:hypothetical protein